MGQIRKRGAFYQIRYYRNGQRIEESTGKTRYDEARDLLRDREGDISKGVPITAKSTRLTFDDAVKDVINDYTVNGKKSKDTVERRIDAAPDAGLRRADAEQHHDGRRAAFAAKRLEAARRLRKSTGSSPIVRRAFRLASEADKYHGRVPKIPMLQERNVRTGFFDDAMIDAVLAKLPAALQPVVTIRLRHRLAGAERDPAARVAARRPEDRGGAPGPRHDEEPGRPGVSLHRHAEDALRRPVGRARGAHEGGHDLPVRVPPERAADQEPAEGVGGRLHGGRLSGKLLHDLRRSAVRNMERAGLSRSVAMQLTGHKTEAVYRRYAITSEADLREGVERLNDVAGTNRGDNRECKREQRNPRKSTIIPPTPGWRNWQTHRT